MRRASDARWPGFLAAALIVVAAACGGGSGGSSSAKEPTGPVVASQTFAASNYSFSPKNATIPTAGVVDVTLHSTESGHTLVIQGVKGFRLVAQGTGDTQSRKVSLQKGTYTFYCDLPGHRAAGMEGKLTVG